MAAAAETVRSPDEAPIRCVDLGLRLGAKTILHGVDVDVRKGEILGVMGRSGTGKTSLLRCMTGLTYPTSGKVFLFGQDLAGLSEDALNALRRRVGLVFQSAALFDFLSVFENVAFHPRRFMRLTEEALGELVAEKLSMVDMAGTEDLMPAQLSGGMRKRVGIARALASGPEVILYDEPAAGLDPIMRGVLDQVIRGLRDELGLTSVVVSHDVEHTFALADRVILLHEGRIHATGGPEEFRDSEDPLVRQFVQGTVGGPLSDRPISGGEP